jgi:hypothetical protein
LAASGHIRVAMLECFACWVDLAYNAAILNSLPYHCLMNCLFQNLTHCEEEISTSAAECLSVIIELVRDQEENGPIIAYLGINIAPLIAQIEHCIANRDDDQTENLLKIVLAFSSKAVHLFANPSPDATVFLHKLVQFTKTRGLDIFKEFADFWLSLLEEVNRQAQAKGYYYKAHSSDMEEIIL